MEHATTRRWQPLAPQAAQAEPVGGSETLEPYGNATSAQQLGASPSVDPAPLLALASAEADDLSLVGPAPSWAQEHAEPGEVLEAMGRRTGPQTKEQALANRRYDLRAVSDLLERCRHLSHRS
jgi:hypothetical protein